MKNPKTIAIWLLWLLAVVQYSAAFKHPLKQQKKHKQQHTQQQQQPFNAFVGLLAAHTAPAIAAYQSVQQYNHSLPLPLLSNGELPAAPPRRVS
jgi:hypothetical protein